MERKKAMAKQSATDKLRAAQAQWRATWRARYNKKEEQKEALRNPAQTLFGQPPKLLDDRTRGYVSPLGGGGVVRSTGRKR